MGDYEGPPGVVNCVSSFALSSNDLNLQAPELGGGYHPAFVTKLVNNYRSHPVLLAMPNQVRKRLLFTNNTRCALLRFLLLAVLC